MTRTYDIPKQLVVQAYKLVKANAGSAGVDNQTLEDFEKDLKNNLYKIWNRMTSGSYFPPAVKAVTIPKKSGQGKRILGVPTVSDRIAQAVVKLVFEPMIEPYFLKDSYGYRPNKSALDAIEVTRKRCWQYNWVLEFDIKGMFDNISHEILMEFVRKHTSCSWILLYIERWLKAPMQVANGELIDRNRGTPQGGVISPLLSNLFLHYVFDSWMDKEHPQKPWCRFADDGLIHCETEEQAQQVLKELTERFKQYDLEMHPDKTRIVYCKDGSRKQKYPNKSFDFLGYTFRARVCKNTKINSLFVSFTPAVSKKAMKAMRALTREKRWRSRTELSLEEIAKSYNPILQGWINYYGKFHRAKLYDVWRHFDMTLVSWAMQKYKSLRAQKKRAAQFIANVAKRNPKLFAHWKAGMRGVYA